jgi:5-(carboxyamino)imidazole ribonucleotide synthase
MEKQFNGPSFRLGILGGGQLGRMLIQEAINFDVHIHILDNDPAAPCAQIAHSFTTGSITDFDAVCSFGKDKDLITVEIENVNIEALEWLEGQGVKVFPQPRVLRIIKDKGLQKQFYASHHFPTAPFRLVDSKDELVKNFNPCVQKLRTGGYDGKGVQLLRNVADLDSAFTEPSIVEELIPFKKELSTIVARNEKGDVKSFPLVECEFNGSANLVEFLFSPAEVTEAIEKQADALARKVIEALDMVGLLAVEFFLTENDELLINEIAPRPHNSGHHTIECNVTSQFEQHLRSILNLPLGSTNAIQAGAMVNLLGESGHDGPAYYQGLNRFLSLPGIHPHLYGKSTTKSYRKMGHVTIAGPSLAEVKQTAKLILEELKVISV